MSIDQLNDSPVPSETEGLDQFLAETLKRHLEPTPPYFTGMILKQIKKVQQQKILAGVILQERLALAGCVLFSCAAIAIALLFTDTTAIVFRSLAVSVTQQGTAFTDRIPQTIKALGANWQSYAIFAGALGFAVYNLVELFLDDSLKTT